MKKTHKKKLRSILLTAILLIILGIGNILFAAYKTEDFRDLNQNLESMKQEEQTPSPQIEARQKKVRAKLNFYKVVNMGGKCLLVVSALLLLYCLIASKEGKTIPAE